MILKLFLIRFLKKWEIHFPINENMIRKIKYYDTFEEVSKIIQKEFGNEVYEKLIEQWFIDELGSRKASYSNLKHQRLVIASFGLAS